MERDAVQRLFAELAADKAYGTGEKPFPRRLSEDEGVAVAEHLHAQIELGVAERDEHAALGRVVIACQRGCNACCEHLVMVYLPEALDVARWLAQPEQAAVKAAFLEAFPRWKAGMGDGPELLGELAAAGKTQEHLAAHVAQWKKRVLCAFNHGGDCTIYPVRPVLCRACHAVDTNEHCRADDPSGIPARTMIYKPLDQFVQKARAFLRVGHHAMGAPRNRPMALCQAVYDLISEPAPAPRS